MFNGLCFFFHVDVEDYSKKANFASSLKLMEFHQLILHLKQVENTLMLVLQVQSADAGTFLIDLQGTLTGLIRREKYCFPL